MQLTLSLAESVAVLCLSIILSTERGFAAWSSDDRLTKEGKRQYEIIQDRIPSYGQCWKESVDKLHEGCKRLTEDVQSRLALSFADCFLKKAGRKGCDCPDDTPVGECLRDVDDVVFDSYREFFTHTQSICFYLQSQAWQERADQSVLKLTESSEKVSHQLQQAGNVQDEILRLQEKSVDSQLQMLENGATLNEEMERSRLHMKEIYHDFLTSSQEHRLQFSEIFEHVSSLHALFVGEFTGLYSYLFYLLAMIAIYLLTSTARTCAARFWLLGVLTVNVVFERMLVSYFLPDSPTARNAFDSNSALYHQVWLIRKVSCTVAICLLVWFSFHYTDYNKLNNQLLTDIQRQNEDIKFRLVTSAGSTPQYLQMNGSIGHSYPPVAICDYSTYDESDDSTYDSTFVGSDSSESESESGSNFSLDHSRSSTPIRDLLPQQLKDAISTLSPACPPQDTTEDGPRYFLRSRQKVQHSNSMLLKESPRTFEKVVKRLARVSQNNRQRMNDLIGRTERSVNDK